MASSSFDLIGLLAATRQATDQLDSVDQCSTALAAMGRAISQRQDDILEANTLDLEISRDMAVPELVVDWLKLTPERVQTTADIFNRLAAVRSPFAHSHCQQSGHGICQNRPVGVVGFIYEAFPDLGAIAAALSIRAGNAIVLKGGSEASRSNQIIASILQGTLDHVGLSQTLILPIESTEVSRLDLTQCPEIDLIIAHGRPSLVQQVAQQATVPVIASRMGNCYLYWSASGSLDQVYHMIVESHSGTPDAVNRIEKVLVHESHSENSLIRLWNRLQEVGFVVKADAAIAQSVSHPLADVTDLEWNTAYLKRIVAFRQVRDGAAAISWINAHSSGHADSLVTADYAESRRFIARCQSTSIYINASPRFVRNAQQTEDIALGMSNGKNVAGGLIGMDVMRSHQHIFHSL